MAKKHDTVIFQREYAHVVRTGKNKSGRFAEIWTLSGGLQKVPHEELEVVDISAFGRREQILFAEIAGAAINAYILRVGSYYKDDVDLWQSMLEDSVSNIQEILNTPESIPKHLDDAYMKPGQPIRFGKW